MKIHTVIKDLFAQKLIRKKAINRSTTIA